MRISRNFVPCLAGSVVVLLCAACGQETEVPPEIQLEPRAPWSLETADLLFTSNRDGNGEIYLLPAGEEEWVNLTNDPAEDNWGEWSPDGSRIAFQSRRSGNLDIWVMNADGSDPVQLTTAPEHDYLPSWTPDGESITFTSWRQQFGDKGKANYIYIMKADGTDQRRLMQESPGTSSGVDWTPDGESFVLTRKVGKSGADVFLADATGVIVGQLTKTEAFSGAPAVSPDGSRIAFYEEGKDGSEIVLMNLAAAGSAPTERRVLVGKQPAPGAPEIGGKNWYPRWSPDGSWIVYTAAVPGTEDEDLNILAIPVDGTSDPRILVAGPGREAEGRWRP